MKKKIQQLSKIICKLNEGKGPDMLGVCEVENKPVLQRLVDSLKSLNRSYSIAHHDTSDQRGIDVAFIYDRELFRYEDQFSHEILKRNATRDIFQVNFKTASGRDLIMIGNHWPSRLNGLFLTEPYRIIAAETLSYWHERILEKKGKSTPIVVVGDFNDEPFNRSLTQYALSTNCKLKVISSRSAPRLFNLMWPLMGMGIGTHYHDNVPGMLDQFMVSKAVIKNDAPLKIKSDFVRIERFPEMMEGSYKKPRRFGRPSSTLDETGFSDHFPISIVLVEN